VLVNHAGSSTELDSRNVTILSRKKALAFRRVDEFRA